MKYILLWALAGWLGASHAAPRPEPALIPAPRSVRWTKGTFRLDAAMAIGYSSPEARRIAGLFHDFLKEQYVLDLPLLPLPLLPLPLLPDTSAHNRPAIVFSDKDTAAGGREGYHLGILSRRISVAGKGAGLFYGLQTLLQLFPGGTAADGTVPCAEIDDAPRYAYRGVMLDVGLHFFPVPFIKRCIDLLAEYKLNVFHWHLTEDQGWRIEIRKYPRLTSVGAWRSETVIGHPGDGPAEYDHTPYGGYYTQEEIRDVVRYAEERYVTIVPEIELPGHCRSALAAYPDLACGDHPGPFEVARSWGIFDDVYCPGKENTFHFLEDVLSEVMDLFPGKYIHIGGDECPKDKWKTCPYCQRRIRDLHLKGEEELQSYFIGRIAKFLHSKGRRLIGWDEILEGGLAPDATVMSWRGTEGGISAARQGHDVIMAPNTALYFDYTQGMDPAQEPLNFGGHNDLAGVYAYEPAPSELTPAQQQHIKGVEACLWTEYMATPAKVTYMLLPRMLALSEVAWTTPERKDAKDFLEERLPVQLARMDRTDLLYRVPEAIGAADTILYGPRFRIELKLPVSGAKIYYTMDSSVPRETETVYDKPLTIVILPGEERVLKTIVITSSGKRSAVTTTIFKNSSAPGKPVATADPEPVTGAGSIGPGPAEYMAGSALVSIDPDSSIFSVALAGYGFPREGRFSIEWKGAGEELSASLRRWQRRVPPSFSSLAALAGKYRLPITCGDLGQTDTMCSICREGRTLYGVSNQNVLWSAVAGRPGSIWKRIGRFNGSTYDIVVKRLTIRRHRLYALAADGRVYRAGHASTGDLSAGALAIRRGGKTIVIVGLDLTGIDHSFVRRVKAILQIKYHLPPSAVFINVSHTHFAPVSQAWTTWAPFLQTPDSGYLYNILEKGIVRSVSMALRDMKPSRLYFGRGTTNIGHNRSSADLRYPYDSTLDVLKVTDLEGRPENILFLTGCHAVFRNDGQASFTLSANFPGITRKIVEERTGAPAAIFIQGCGGDINPTEQDPGKTGIQLADDISTVLQGHLRELHGDLSYSLDSMSLALNPWTEEKVRQFKEENSRRPGDVGAEKNVRWADLMLRRYRLGNMPRQWPEYVHTLNIGDWKLVGLSREAVTEYGMAIRALWPGRLVSVAGYTNAVPSYLPNRWHIETGVYEGSDSFFWYGQAGIPGRDLFPKIVEQIKEWNR